MPPKPIFYDASSPNEQAPSLPSAPLAKLSDTCVLQPPLSRRGTGPGLLIILPSHTAPSKGKKPLDPEPVQKWAEEGFAVVGITPSETLADDVLRAIGALQALSTLDTKDKFGIILHDTAIPVFPEQIACLVSYSPHAEVSHSIPIYVHTPSTENSPSNATVSVYPDVKSAHFVLPNSADYDAPSANLAHTRTLVFLRNHLGGPHFDIEAIWEEHTYWEFERRSVAQTMATMVAEPYVNHVPTMTGGMGRANLTAFYRDHFIFCNPPDTALRPVSRTVGPDRVVDEFIFTFTHTNVIPWLMPGVKPTNKPMAIPFVAVVNVRGDRLYHEHIWWDQACALKQAGLMPTHVEANGVSVRLPVAGSESARLLADESDGRSNEMIEWSTQ